MQLVLNEWFLDYMAPESLNVRLILRLLDAIETKGDQIVIKRPSPFTEKFYRLNKLYGNQGQPSSRPVFRRFALLMRDDRRVRLVEEEEIQSLPEAVLEFVDPEDRYLAEIAALTRERTIVTTDTKLKDKLNGKDGFRVTLLDEFLEEYLPKGE